MIVPGRLALASPLPGSYRYFRWRTRTRRLGGNTGVQASEFQILVGGSRVAASSVSGASDFGETVVNLNDNSTSTKWYKDVSWNTVTTIDFDYGSAITPSGYRWYTTDLYVDRDPVTWEVWGSNDALTWTILDNRVGEVLTTVDRQALVGPFTFNNPTIPSSPFVRYVRFRSTKRRSSTTENDFSEFAITNGGTRIPASHVIDIHTNNPYIITYDITKLNDNDPSTVFNDQGTGSQTSTRDAIFDYGYTNPTFDGYYWSTSTFGNTHDPVSWEVASSQDGVIWTTLDTQTDYATTTSRATVVGPFTVTSPARPTIVQSNYIPYTSTASPTVTIGLGATEGQLLVAFIGDSNMPNIIVPAGWDNPLGGWGGAIGSPNAALYCLTHLVTAAEEAAAKTSWTLTGLWTGTSTGWVTALVVDDVNTFHPIDAVNMTLTSTATTTHVMAGLEGDTLLDNSLVVSCVIADAARSYTTAPTGWSFVNNTTTATPGMAVLSKDAASIAGVDIAATNITVSSSDEYHSITVAFTSSSEGPSPTCALVQSATGAINFTTSLAVTLGSTPVVGNLLVAVATYRSTNSTPTISGTGWSTAITHSVVYNSARWEVMWWKVAGASEPTSITITYSPATQGTAVVSEYSGLTTPTLAAVTPGSTPLNFNETRVNYNLPAISAGPGIAVNSAWFQSSTMAAAATITNRFIEVTEVITSGAASQHVAWRELTDEEPGPVVVQTTNGAIINVVYVFVNDGEYCPHPYLYAVGEIGEFATGTTITTPIPAGAAADDYMVLALMCNESSTFTTPSGWTEIGTAIESDANQSTKWFAKVHSGSESNPASTTSATLSATIGGFGRIIVFRGVDTAGPVEDVTMFGSPTTSNVPDSAAIDTTGAHRLVVCLMTFDNSHVWANGHRPPTWWSGCGLQTRTTTASDAFFDAMARYVRFAGPVEVARTGTLGASAYWRTLTMGLVPAPVEVTVTNYTELEWSIALQDPATGTYEFRVYAEDEPLVTYLATPQLTVGSADIDLVVANATHLQTAQTAQPEVGLVVADAAHLHTAQTAQPEVLLVPASAAQLQTAEAITVEAVLVPATATHLQTADATVLTFLLTVADAAQTQTSDATVLTPLLVAADATQAHTSDVVGIAVGGIDLVVASAAHVQTADPVVLTPLLQPADATHLHTAETAQPAVNLVAADTQHLHTAEATTIGADIGLVVANASQAQTADNTVISVSLVVADAQHLHTAATAQPAVSLVVADAAQLHTAATTYVALSLTVADTTHLHTAAGITVEAQLVAANAAQLHTAGATVLTWDLTPANATHSTASDNVVFTSFTLSVDNATHSHVATGVAISEGGTDLVVAGATQSQTSANVVFTSFDLTVNSAAQTQTSDSPLLSANLVVANAAHGHAADNVTFGVNIVVADAAHTQTAGAVLLAAELAAADATHLHTAAAPTLAVTLVVDGATHLHTAETATFGINLIVADAAHAQTVEAVVVVRAFDLAIASATHVQVAEPLTLAIFLVVASTTHIHRAETANIAGVVKLNDALALYLGAQVVQAAYVGATKVWP